MRLVLIGSSTGGPNQLRFLLGDIEVKNTCVIVVQHMVARFIPSFVKQFSKHSLSKVSALEDGEVLSNKIYICCKNTILSMRSSFSGSPSIVSHWQDIQTHCSPNVDLLFNSAIELVRENTVLAIILTGMGDDGAKSLLKLHEAGAKCLAENEEDSVVYGMPKRAKQINPDLRLMGLKDIKREILDFIK